MARITGYGAKTEYPQLEVFHCRKESIATKHPQRTDTSIKKREPVSRFPLKKCLIIRFGLAEVALQQALESLAMTGRSPWDRSHGGPADFICSGGMNPPGIEVLPPAKHSVTRPSTAKKDPGPLDRDLLSTRISRSNASAGPQKPCHDGPFPMGQVPWGPR